MKLDNLSLKEYKELTKKLSRYCWRYQKKHQQSPTLKQAAKRFNLKHDDIETLSYDCDNIDIIEGGRIGGLGGGIFTYENRGECLLECYEDPEKCPT